MARVTGRWVATAVLAAGLALAGCEVEEDNGTRDAVDTGSDAAAPDAAGPDVAGPDVAAEPLAIAGTYTDGFGGEHAITQETWTQAFAGSDPSVFRLTKWDNADYWVVGQNDAANAYNPGLWSRFDWATWGGGLYFCQTRYDAANEAEALAATPADPTAPTTGGCGGFPWTSLTPAVGG